MGQDDSSWRPLRSVAAEISLLPPLTERPRNLSILGVWAVAVGLLLAGGCYESDEIVALAVSPDGGRVAVLNERGEFGVLELRGPGPMTIYSNHARRGMAWSPDSRRIAFVEQFPGEPSGLWVLNLETGQRGARPLLGGLAWKADPVWLSEQSVAFLCDQEADAPNIWLVGVQADGSPDRPFRLLDPKADVSRLWGTPAGPALYYQAADEGEPALWRWRPGGAEPEKLIERLTDGFDGRNSVSFGADFRHVAALVDEGEGEAVAWFDLVEEKEAGRLELTRPAAAIQTLNDGRVAISQSDRVLLWNPEAGWLERRLAETQWWGAPVRVFGESKSEGLVAVVHGNLLLTARKAGALEEGELHVRLNEDVIRLAWRQAEIGRMGDARRLLQNLWEKSGEGSQARPTVALAFGLLERLESHWKRADTWLGRAIEAAVPGSLEAHLGRVERLALAFFDARDTRGAVAAMVEISNSPMDADIAAPTRPLLEWIEQVLTSKDIRLQREWQGIGGRIRQGDYARAARDLRRAMSNEAWTTENLMGLRVVIEGMLDPIEQAVGSGPPRALEPLMQQVDFQETLMLALRMNAQAGPTAADLRSLLMEQWVMRGDASLARQLVREDLADDPEGSTEPYTDLLRQYLVAEERPPWLDRVVTDTLLEPEVAEVLLAPLREVEDKLSVRLAQTRAALIAGRTEAAQARLAEAWILASRLPPEAVSIERATRGGRVEPAGGEGVEGDLAEAAFRQIQLVYLMELYQAKISEAQGKWSDALRAYRACLALMDKAPADWDVAPYEVTLSIALIEEGSADSEGLQSLLRVRRQLGDPLIEPTRDAGRVRQALENIVALEGAEPEPWLARQLQLARGLGLSVLRQPEHALQALARARAMEPPTGTLQRILLEEAALREAIGESALAARLYSRIMTLRVSLSVRAAAVVALVHAEQSAGIETEPEDRLLQMMPGDTLPSAWREWLWVQVGAGGDHGGHGE